MNESSYWAETRAKFRNKKPEDYPTFKTWEEVGEVPLYTFIEIFDEQQRDVEAWISKKSKKAQKLWQSALAEPEYGHNKKSIKFVRSLMETRNGIKNSTPWSYKSAHHVTTYESLSGKDILEYDRILEFGAGIGDTARFIHDIGFGGKYEILDSKEIGTISTTYLKALGHEDVLLHTDLSTVESVKSNEKTLFIGTWSLSEVPFDYRVEVLKKFVKSDFLITYQKHVFGYNNEPWFLMEFPQLTNTFYRLLHMYWHDGQGGNFYQVSAPSA